MNPDSATRPVYRTIAILGPQRFRPTVARTLDDLGVAGPVALVTAGWQERESEIDELRAHIDRPALNLELYRRADAALERDGELAAALRDKQSRLRQMQELYRLRLDHALDASRELMRRNGAADLLRAERRSAIRALRTLDDGHLRRVRAVHEEFDRRWRPAKRPAVARQREELTALLADCRALLVAGGHVAVLLNRMRLFELLTLLGKLPVVAWSAGAMALSDKLVLFHDSPPQGPGNAEVLDNGLGLAPGLVALPHAGARLRLDDPVRVSLLARRFAPAVCVALDPGSAAEVGPTGLRALSRTMRLTVRGGVSPL